mmetsp:Transcript_3827/g.10762  ORF Transcript_3827/g.10762 Transcript_3827/m.10762 type:complete len:446 (+) Transcript_3827:43-1380(+)|eukprot:CAMPEP_0185186772 /NCGR_PEP_ID=MMETSP1140-20130426/4277_1 /TAXON_ID=298111 /ORGANISM="Pavlova sp., Strain CCMP459" /LENGTH=445 /DNA_ID=CAMNT_0027753093 /DNA_START=43 /DNA_END=1380 /DNA_ORIENTATION=-
MATEKAAARSPVPFWWGGTAGLLAAFFFILGTCLRLALNYHSPVEAPNPFQDTLSMVNLDKYPGYTKDLQVKGYITVVMNGRDYVGLSGRMRGLEKDATGGIHIHEGMSCQTSGKHYYNRTDPWEDITYTSDDKGRASVAINIRGFSLHTDENPLTHEKPLNPVVGHALVVHGKGGERVACGTISSPRKPNESFAKLKKFDVDLLRQLWDWRAANANIEVAKDFMSAISFFLLASAVRALAEVFDMHRSGHKASMFVLVPCFTFASIMAIIELTFKAGATGTASWIGTQWDLDEDNLSALELSYFMTQSRGVWFFALEWWFLGAGMLTAAYLNARSGLLSTGWTVISVLIALASVVGFTAEVGRLVNFRLFVTINTVAAVVTTMVLLPIWLIWAGRHLQGLSGKEFQPISVGENGGGGMEPAAPAVPPQTRDDHEDAIEMSGGQV